MIKVLFKNSTKINLENYKFLASSLFEKVIEKMNLFSEKQRIFVELNIVGEIKIKKLNFQYRSKNQITDVLSFSLMEGDDFNNKHFPIINLGEIYICWNKVLSDAKKYCLSIEREFSYLFVHGLLHIFGYDHQSPAQEKRMNDLSESILKSFKIIK